MQGRNTPYGPNGKRDRGIFTCMCAVFEEHLKTDKGKSLVSEYEDNEMLRAFIVSSSDTPRALQQHKFLEIVF